MRGGKQSPSKLSGVPTVCVLALGDVGRKTIRFKILTEKKTHLQTSTFNSLKKIWIWVLQSIISIIFLSPNNNCSSHHWSLWSEALKFVFLVLYNLPFHSDINLPGLPKWRWEWSVYRCKQHSALTRGSVWLARPAALPCSVTVSHSIWLFLQASSDRLRCLRLRPGAQVQAGSVGDGSCRTANTLLWYLG